MPKAAAGEHRAGPRAANFILGLWLLASSFEWAHTGVQTTNGAVVGALSIVVSLLAIRLEGLRWVDTALGAWLLVSTWALPHVSGATMWNNTLVAVAMIIVSTVPNGVPALQETRRTVPT